MTPEQIANIGAFMQFERLRYEQQGSGLGLTLALLLTRLNRGELTVESLPNQGTTITLVFNHETIATSP
jgi:signal transduction histidine kinase